MVNSILFSLSTFFMSTIKVSIEVLNQIDIYRSVTPRVSNPHDYVNHMFKRP
jgi:hypothetical protein